MKRIATIILLALAAVCAEAKPVTVRLWPDGAPNSNGCTGQEYIKNNVLYNVTDPAIVIYPAPRPGSKAIICCPGGGYAQESAGWEKYAPLFNNMNVTYVILKYRLPERGHHEVPLSDILQSVRILRERAEEWNIDPSSIGVMGFSAGGHLAAAAACLYDEESRPDFQILVYPVISMDEKTAHMGSRISLIGDSPSKELIERYSLEKQVNARTPKAFIILAGDDTGVSPLNSIGYYRALIAHKVSATLHIYPTGGHGFGMLESMPWRYQWLSELEKWLSMN